MDKLSFQPFEVKPPIVLMTESRRIRRYAIYWGDEKYEDEHGKEVYKIYSVQLGRELSYGSIVSAIIASRFSNDEVTAISLNYLHKDNAVEDKAVEYSREYHELQEWRVLAKEVAAKAIAFAKDKGWIEQV